MDTSSPEPVVDTRNASDSCANLITRAVDDLAPGGSVLLVADHNSHHIGEFAILRQVMSTWPPDHS